MHMMKLIQNCNSVFKPSLKLMQHLAALPVFISALFN